MQTEDRSILLVDDDREVLDALGQLIQSHGYAVTTMDDPNRALRLVEKADFAVVISDQLMPAMTGLEFLARVRKELPFSSLILITGMPSLETVISAINSGDIFHFLSKPFDTSELFVTLRNAQVRYQLLAANHRLQEERQLLNEQLREANIRLHEKVLQLAEKTESIGQSHAALEENFKRSLDLCHRLIATFSPMLGKDTRSVVEICQHFCDQGDFTDAEKQVLMVSAWLHNVGMLAVPRETLNRYYKKPKSLNDQDLKLIQSHPVFGQSITAFADNLAKVGLTIRAHHERWDGSGYPDNCRQENIPKMARYLAVACAYVESKLPRVDAIEKIIEDSGKGFYPDAVRLFLKATRLTPLPKQIREITFAELREGMVMASPLHSPSGLMLLPEGQRITEDILLRIRHHDLIDSLSDRLLIYV